MAFPDTNTRQIKRTAEGLFTVEGLGELAKEKSLCAYCGRKRCSIRASIRKMSSEEIVPSIRACGEFVPVLAFSILKGLNLDAWNTIRVGQAWAKRLEPGMNVAIADMLNRKIVRHMTVVETYTDTIDRLCSDHAINNHAILADGLTHGEAPGMMRQILRNAYGSNFAAPDRTGTVIYLAK